jgi:formylglycine-generating enzyme required for sulfatase activity
MYYEIFEKFFLLIIQEYKINNININNNIHGINPLNWELGHIIWFYNNYSWKKNIKMLKNEIYDSFLLDYVNRSKYVLDLDKLYKIWIRNKNLIKDNKLLCDLHLQMHIESLYFSLLLININNIQSNNKQSIKLINKLEKTGITIKDIEYIDISGNKFIQGNHSNNYYIFDNEIPVFETVVNDFKVSKYPITIYQYLQFVKSGYNKKKYWSINGYSWKNRNNITLPLYWKKYKRNYYFNYNNVEYLIKDIADYPMIFCSYYEAEAYCNWKKVKLLTESEWEYLGNFKEVGNPNLGYNGLKPVYSGSKIIINNKNIIYDLVGNVWEWCSTDFYPYDNFTIGKIYKEFSYPFFGYKNICRGGSWCSPKELINIHYRNAQTKDNRIQFIGFRIKLT